MAAARIVRVPVLDSHSDFVVLKVESSGSKELDLQIEGTDEEAIFTASINHSNHDKLRTEPINISNGDWTRALVSVFSPGVRSAPVKDIELLAKIESNRLILVIRKNVQGITQRLGEVVLHRDDDREIRLFEWVGISALSDASAHKKVWALETRDEQQEKEKAKLKADLDDQVASTIERENAWLANFSHILNLKKAKIRDQQRLLTHAKIDSKAASSVNGTRARSAKSSRSLKRKADLSGTDEDVSGSDPETEDDDQEGRIVDQDGSDREQDSGLDDELLAEHPSRPSQDASARPSQVTSQQGSRSQPGSRTVASQRSVASQASQPAPSSSAAANDDDDETTDDEL